MNTSIVTQWVLTTLPLLVGVAHAGDAPVGRFKTGDGARIEITHTDGSPLTGSVRVASGRRYTLQQTPALNARERASQWLFLIQPATRVTTTGSDVFERNPGKIRDEVVRLLAIDPGQKGASLQGRILARTKVEGPTRAGIPFTPIVWWATMAKPSESLVRHRLTLQPDQVDLALGSTSPFHPNAARDQRPKRYRGRVSERDGQLVFNDTTPIVTSKQLRVLLHRLEEEVVTLEGTMGARELTVTQIVFPRTLTLRGRVKHRDDSIRLSTEAGEWILGGRLSGLIPAGRELQVRGRQFQPTSPFVSHPPAIEVTAFQAQTVSPTVYRGRTTRALAVGQTVWVTGVSDQRARVRMGRRDYGWVARSALGLASASSLPKPAGKPEAKAPGLSGSLQSAKKPNPIKQTQR